ncbi:MAG: hypothetical protein RLZZ403_488, partial [Pseudomonadota bacterium]
VLQELLADLERADPIGQLEDKQYLAGFS